MKDMKFGIYDGRVTSNFWVDTTNPLPAFGVDLELERISLARMRRPGERPVLDGSLFLVGHARGEGFSPDDLNNKLTGSGKLMLTNGEFHTVDVLGSLASVGQFVGLQPGSTGTTRFHDVTGGFVIQKGKIQTDHILIHSDDLYVDAAGDVDLEGNLNFRLQTALSEELSRRIYPDLKVGDRLGPIPLLLTGKISDPVLAPDVQDFLSNLATQSLEKIIPIKDWFKTPPTEESIKKEAPSAPSQTSSEQTANTQKVIQTGMALLESLFNER